MTTSAYTTALDACILPDGFVAGLFPSYFDDDDNPSYKGNEDVMWSEYFDSDYYSNLAIHDSSVDYQLNYVKGLYDSYTIWSGMDNEFITGMDNILAGDATSHLYCPVLTKSGWSPLWNLRYEIKTEVCRRPTVAEAVGIAMAYSGYIELAITAIFVTLFRSFGCLQLRGDQERKSLFAEVKEAAGAEHM